MAKTQPQGGLVKNQSARAPLSPKSFSFFLFSTEDYPLIIFFVCFFQEQYYLKSCLDIQADFPDSLSELYSIQPVLGGKVITVYCEMAIAGGGFTFVPRTAIRGNESQQMISELFTDRTQVLMRIQKKDGTQPFTLVQQLPEYKQNLLGARVNNYDGYTSPVNSHLGDYLLLGNKTIVFHIT